MTADWNEDWRHLFFGSDAGWISATSAKWIKSDGFYLP
jgi:hypothetical protein